MVNFDLGDELGTFCFDDFSFARTALLPVEYTSFWGQKRNDNSVILHWITALEDNVSYFELERSNDLATWKKIGKIAAKGEAHHYKMRDNSPFNGQNYYRFKSVDFDGAITFSEIISIKIKQSTVSVYPNPFANALTIDSEEMVTVEMFNLAGQKIKQVNVDQNSHSLIIPTGDFPKGTYTVSYTHLTLPTICSV